MNCQEIQRIVWTEGPETVPSSHLEECRACREESRRAAALQTALAGMRDRFAVPPPTLEPQLLAAIERSRFGRAREIVAQPRFWRGAAVGAAAAAAAATAAIGIIAVRRRAAAGDAAA